MADKFTARKDGKYRVICTAPDVCKIANGTPVPFFVTESLNNSAKHAKKTNYNGKKVFMLRSHTTKVTGDEPGVLKGVKSGTVRAKAEPIEHSTSIKVEGSWIVRVGDKVYMNSKNTIGKVVFSPSPTQGSIKDNGDIDPSQEEQSMFDDLKSPTGGGSPAQGGSAHSPLASPVSGSLGSTTGSPVLLKTGQLFYKEELVELIGLFPIDINLTYISREQHSECFGNHWFFEYGTRFKRISKDDEGLKYRLVLSDGRKFDFLFDLQTKTFIDQGKLGVDVKWNEKGDFELKYLDGLKEYYEQEKLVKKVDGNGNSLTLNYDDKERLSSIKSNSNTFFKFEYTEANNLITQMRDHSGRCWKFQYDGAGNLYEIATPAGGKRQYAYQQHIENNENNNSYLLTSVTDSFYQEILNATYNDEGQVSSYEEKGLAHSYSYQLDDRVVIKKSPNQITTYSLDQYGFIDGISENDNIFTHQEWDQESLTATITTGSGKKETKIFDDSNRLIKYTNERNETTKYSYKGTNLKPSSIKTPTGLTSNTYDNRYNLLSSTDEKGKIESFTYNKKGEVTQVTDEDGTTKLKYNNLSQVISVTDEQGYTTNYEYDDLGREQRLTDAEGRELLFTYNENDLVTHIYDPSGHSYKYNYDEEGRLTCLTDSAGNQTHYDYDRQGRLISEQKSDGKPKEYHYNQQGKLKRVKREDGSEIKYDFDSQGRMKKETIGDMVTYYSFDSFNRLIDASTSDSNIRFSYTEEGRIESQTQNDTTVESAYVNNKLINLSFLNQSIDYQRNKQGIIESIRNNEDEAIHQTYDKSSQLTKRLYPNKQHEIINFDEFNNIKKIQTAEKEIKYKTDKTGLITKKNNTQYEYDQGGRLICAGKDTFEYDRTGNITRKANSEDPTTENKSSYDNANNQLLENTSHTFSYDLRGNLVKKVHKASGEILHYQFNEKNQLTRVHGTTYGNLNNKLVTQNIHFQYDAIGRRIKKQDNGTTYQYIYDNLNIIAIHIDDGEEQDTVTITHDDVDDTPLSISNKNGTFYYHRDHQGSIVALTNSEGMVVESISYDDSYGNIIEHQRTVETNNPYGYTGRETDTYDLYYYRARYYDPSTQRFLSEDPIGFLSGDFNYYAYISADPINNIDPLGYKGKTCLSKKHAKALAKIGKKLGKKLGKAFAKRVATTMASLATGPGAILVAVGNIGMSLWDLYSAKDDIMELYDTLQEADLDLGKIDLKKALGNVMDGNPPLPDCDKKKKEVKGKKGGTGKGQGSKKPKCKKHPSKGRPVNPVLGSKILSDEEDLDFIINSPIPLVWQRSYSSDSPNEGLLGQGWMLLLDSHLLIKQDKIFFIEPNGRKLEFNTLETGESDEWVTEQLTLSRPKNREYRIATPDQTLLVFKPSQTAGKYQLDRLEDLNGNTIHYHYNGNNIKGQESRLTHIKTGDARVFELVYISVDKNHLRLGGIDELLWENDEERVPQTASKQRLVSYEYSPEADLVCVTNKVGRLTREFEYKNHIMVAHKIPQGLESYYEYDKYEPKGKVLRNHTNNGEEWFFTYKKQQTLVTDQLGRETLYIFDKDDYLTGTVDALGQTMLMELDKDGLPEKVIDEAQREKELEYDSRGNVTTIKDIDGTTTLIGYHDSFNLPTEITDDLGNTTKLDYDDKGNLIAETQADGASYQYKNDVRGLPIEITDPNGGISKMAYDAAGNLIERIDCSNQKTYYYYDRNSNLTEIEDALGQTTQYHYDQEERLIKIEYPDGSKETFEYNTQGQLTLYTDPKSNQTHYKLDIEGRPTTRTNSLGNTLKYQYDSVGRLTRLINENNAEYKFAYDPLDRLIHEQGVDGLITGYDYDAVGNVTEKRENETSEEQRVTRYIRDTGGRLEEKYIGKGKLESRTRYQYDELGQLAQARNEHSRVDLAYDPMGRLTSEKTSNRSGSHQLKHKYDGFGNRINTLLPNGKKLNWLYYGSGHLHQINLDGKVIADYERDALHREISRSQGTLQNNTRYDPLGRILQQQAQRQNQLQEQDKDTAPHPLNQQSNENAKNNPVQIQRNYQYDRSGELTQLKDLRNGTTNYQYDALGRIINTQQGNLSETFSFDPAHNLIPAGGDAIKDNKLTVFEDKRYEYDTFGNMTQKKTGSHTKMTFSYDAEHQMQQAFIDKRGVTQTVNYKYDPFGRRISKQDSFGLTSFVWDGNRLLSESRGSQGKIFVYEQDGFVPVAQVMQDDEIQHYHTDHLGTPRELTNQDGEITWEATYQTWGNTVKVVYQEVETEEEDALEPAVQPLRFQGQYFDEETGLHYNRFRYYDPDIGRFVSQDPIGLFGGDNLYQYAPNPIYWLDPLGLAGVPTKAGDVGAFKDLKGVVGDNLTPHHMPQDALGHMPRADGCCLVLTHEEHKKTRTYAGRGKTTKAADKDRPFKDVLQDDIDDIKQIAGNKYDSSLKKMVKIYEGHGLIKKGDIKC